MVTDLTRDDLAEMLRVEGINSYYYSLTGGNGPDTVAIEASPQGAFSVYYSERGVRADELWFHDEDAACRYFITLLENSIGHSLPSPDEL
jgi:hypothetical protein